MLQISSYKAVKGFNSPTNELILTSAFLSSPMCVVLMDDESFIPVHKSMRLIITQIIKKQIGFVNGQFVNVVAVRNKTKIFSQ